MMKKLKTAALFAALALSVLGAGIGTSVLAWANETPVGTLAAQSHILPLVETSFDDGTVGQHYQIDLHESAFWDQNYANGSIADSFDGKAYRFSVPANSGTTEIGGIHVPGAVEGESYTLTMKANSSGCDFIYVEYVADDNALGNGRWGGFKLYQDRIESLEANNSFVDFDADTKEFKFTFTAGKKVWDEVTSEPGFIKFTASNSTEGAYFDIDDVTITVAQTLMNEDCEGYETGVFDRGVAYGKFWNEASSLSAVEYGTGNKAVKFTANDASTEYCVFGYLNRLGFVTNNALYSVSFDYEIRGYDTLFIEYTPSAGGAGIKVLSSGEVQSDWGTGVNLNNARVTIDPDNPAKGTVSFEWNVLENKTEFKFTGKQDAVNAEEEHALLIDNISIDAMRTPITVKTVAGNGSFSAQTFRPRTGSDGKIYVIPDVGWHVKEVLLDGLKIDLDAEGAYAYTAIDEAHTLSAEFERNAINVSVDVSAGVQYTVTENVYYGDKVTLTVTLVKDYKLTSVKLNGKDIELTQGTYVISSAEEDLRFIVLAEKISEFTMSYESTQEGGTVTCSAEKVLQGGSAEFTVTPAEGWRIKSVKYNGKNVSLSDGKYTVENVTADGKLTVEFERIEVQQPDVDPDKPDEGGNDPDVGPIVGIVCGVVGICAIAAVVTIVLLKKKKTGKGGASEKKDGEK